VSGTAGASAAAGAAGASGTGVAAQTGTLATTGGGPGSATNPANEGFLLGGLLTLLGAALLRKRFGLSK
jgi:hypothetical protein